MASILIIYFMYTLKVLNKKNIYYCIMTKLKKIEWAKGFFSYEWLMPDYK